MLAWRRTCLASAAATVAVTKLFIGDLGIGAVILGGTGIGLAVTSAAVAHVQNRRARRGLMDPQAMGRSGAHIGLLSLAVTILILLCAAFVALRAVHHA